MNDNGCIVFVVLIIALFVLGNRYIKYLNSTLDCTKTEQVVP